jgi:hypothetical protein
MGDWVEFGKPWRHNPGIEFSRRPEPYTPETDAVWSAEYHLRKADQEAGTFTKLGLNKPGTLVELEDGQRLLIGDINDDAGVCGCCSVINDTAIVKRYKVVWTSEQEQDDGVD